MSDTKKRLRELERAQRKLNCLEACGYALAELVMDVCGNPKGVSESDQELLYETAMQYSKKARGEA